MAVDKRKMWKEYKRSLLMYKLSKDKNSPAMKKLALRLNKTWQLLMGCIILLASCSPKSDYTCNCNAYGKVDNAGSKQSKYWDVEHYYDTKADDATERCNAFTDRYKSKYADTVSKQNGWLGCTLEDTRHD